MLKTGVQAQDSNPDYRLFWHNGLLFCSGTIRNRRVSVVQSTSIEMQSAGDGMQWLGEGLQSAAEFVQSRATEVVDGQETGEGCGRGDGIQAGYRCEVWLRFAVGDFSAIGFGGDIPENRHQFGLDVLYGEGRVRGRKLCDVVDVEGGSPEAVSQSGGGTDAAAEDGIVRVEVEVKEWDLDLASLTMRMRPDVTARRLQRKRMVYQELLPGAVKQEIGKPDRKDEQLRLAEAKIKRTLFETRLAEADERHRRGEFSEEPDGRELSNRYMRETHGWELRG